MQAKSLTQKTFIGVLWNFTEQVLRRGVQGIVTVILAFLLLPSDFGLVAMLAIFIALGNSLIDSGFKQALIRLDNPSQQDFNTAFYANIVFSVLAFIILFVAAPYIALFYEEPILLDLVRALSFTLIINAFQVVQVASISREMQFKKLLLVNVPAAVISGGVAVGLAFLDYGVWSLVVQMLVSSFLLTVFLWLVGGWRPTLSLSKTSFITLYQFGYKLLLSEVIVRIVQNLYISMIAKYFSATVAGYYFFANKIQEILVIQLVIALQNVTFPALSKIKNDDEKLKYAYRKIVKIMVFTLYPIIIVAAVLSDIMFKVIFPEKWWDAALYLQLLLLGSILIPLHAINLNILTVKGRSDLFLYLEIIKAIMLISILFISLPYGIEGVLIGGIVFSILAYIPNSFFSVKLIGYSIREQLFDFMPALLLSSWVGLVLLGIQYLLPGPSLWLLLFLCFISVPLYLLPAYMLKMESFVYVKELLLKQRSRTKK